MAVTNAVSWRSEGVRHKKNEVFLDVVESVNLLVSSAGQVVASEVQGTLKMRTFLSGMPECKLGLNDKVLFEAQGRAGRQKAVDLEDVRFHQCVRLVSHHLFFVIVLEGLLWLLLDVVCVVCCVLSVGGGTVVVWFWGSRFLGLAASDEGRRPRGP